MLIECVNCRFWEPVKVLESGDLVGRCRRHAPAAVTVSNTDAPDYEARWPLTRDGDGCGEYRVRTWRAARVGQTTSTSTSSLI